MQLSLGTNRKAIQVHQRTARQGGAASTCGIVARVQVEGNEKSA